MSNKKFLGRDALASDETAMSYYRQDNAVLAECWGDVRTLTPQDAVYELEFMLAGERRVYAIDGDNICLRREQAIIATIRALKNEFPSVEVTA